MQHTMCPSITVMNGVNVMKSNPKLIVVMVMLEMETLTYYRKLNLL